MACHVQPQSVVPECVKSPESPELGISFLIHVDDCAEFADAQEFHDYDVQQPIQQE